MEKHKLCHDDNTYSDGFKVWYDTLKYHKDEYDPRSKRVDAMSKLETQWDPRYPGGLKGFLAEMESGWTDLRNYCGQRTSDADKIQRIAAKFHKCGDMETARLVYKYEVKHIDDKDDFTGKGRYSTFADSILAEYNMIQELGDEIGEPLFEDAVQEANDS